MMVSFKNDFFAWWIYFCVTFPSKLDSRKYFLNVHGCIAGLAIYIEHKYIVKSKMEINIRDFLYFGIVPFFTLNFNIH